MAGGVACPCLGSGGRDRVAPSSLFPPDSLLQFCPRRGSHRTGTGKSPLGGGGVLADCPALIAGPTSPPWTTPSAVWGSSSTCRRRRRRRTPGCRPGGSTTSSGRTSWWICTSRCEGGARVHTPPRCSLPHPQTAAGICCLRPPLPGVFHNNPGPRGQRPVPLSVPTTVLVHSRCSINVQMMCSLD